MSDQAGHSVIIQCVHMNANTRAYIYTESGESVLYIIVKACELMIHLLVMCVYMIRVWSLKLVKCESEVRAVGLYRISYPLFESGT